MHPDREAGRQYSQIEQASCPGWRGPWHPGRTPLWSCTSLRPGPRTRAPSPPAHTLFSNTSNRILMAGGMSRSDSKLKNVFISDHPCAPSSPKRQPCTIAAAPTHTHTPACPPPAGTPACTHTRSRNWFCLSMCLCTYEKRMGLEGEDRELLSCAGPPSSRRAPGVNGQCRWDPRWHRHFVAAE